MEKFFSSLIGFAAIVPLFAGLFADQINFVSRWEINRDEIVIRSLDNYTDNMTGEFHEEGHQANMRELENFYKAASAL